MTSAAAEVNNRISEGAKHAADNAAHDAKAHMPPYCRGRSSNEVQSSAIRDARSPEVLSTMEKAQYQADKTELKGRNEEDTPERRITTVRTQSAEKSEGRLGTTMPVSLPAVDEGIEGASTTGRSGKSANSRVASPSVDGANENIPEKRNHSQASIRHVMSSETEMSRVDSVAPQLPPLSASPESMDPGDSILEGLNGFIRGSDPDTEIREKV